MAPRKRVTFWFVVAGVLVAAGVAVAVLAIPSGHESRAQGNAAVVKFGSSQVSRLERAFTAHAIGSQAAVVAPQIRGQFLRRGQSLLPAGSHVRIDAATFRLTRTGFAAVNAVITGPEAGRWQLILIGSRGNWLLIGTRRLP